MKYIKIVCLVLFVVLIAGCSTKEKRPIEPIKDTIDTINSTKDKVSLTNIDILLTNVQTAYLNAYMNNGASNPTFKQVLEAFKMDNIEMLEDGTFKSNGNLINCKSIIDNNNLKVSCDVNGITKETKASMPLSKQI